MEKIKSTLKEKIFYAFGNMGGYVLWNIVAVYVAIYVSDCIQPGEKLVTLFGTIILICRFFDGFIDIVMGLMIEKTHSKLGKARFWFGISIIPLTIIFCLIFFTSGLDKTLAIVAISIFYFLFTVVFYTMNNVAFNAMLPRISEDKYDQSNICTLNSIFTSIGSLIGAFGLTILNALGGKNQQSSWTILIIAIAVFALIFQSLSFFKVKEKLDIKKEEPKQDKEALKKGLKTLLKTKYFYIAVMMFCINYYISLSVSTVGIYYSTYVLGNENLYSTFVIFPMITMGIGLIVTPLLVKKINKKRTLMLAIGFVVLGNVLGCTAPYSYAVAITGAIIKGFGLAVVMSQLFTLAPDIVTYVEAKEGIRVEGLAASANSFGCKIGSGFGSAIVLWTLPLCGYIAGGVQPQSAINSFIALYWWVPTALSIVLLVLASFWDINKKATSALEKSEIV